MSCVEKSNAYSEPCWISKIEPFLIYLRELVSQKFPSYMFQRVLNERNRALIYNSSLELKKTFILFIKYICFFLDQMGKSSHCVKYRNFT